MAKNLKLPFIDKLSSNSILYLRASLAIVYIWFGALKILGVSPVLDLIKATYPSYPEPTFIIFLGIWEIIIGFGLLFKKYLKWAILLLFIQMGGIFFGVLLSPSSYFTNNNVLLLNVNGEFVVKNLVLVAAALVIWKHEVKD